jgi:hypothetical protein
MGLFAGVAKAALTGGAAGIAKGASKGFASKLGLTLKDAAKDRLKSTNLGKGIQAFRSWKAEKPKPPVLPKIGAPKVQDLGSLGKPSPFRNSLQQDDDDNLYGSKM